MKSRIQSPRIFSDTTVNMIAKPGKAASHQEPLSSSVAAVGEHGAPGGHAFRHAQTEEGQRRLGQDNAGNVEGGDDDQRRQDVGQDGAEHDAPFGGAQGAHGFDVFALALHQRLGAGDARVGHPLADAQDQDQVQHAFAQNRQHHDGEEDEGVSQLNIGQAHDEVIDAAADR